MSTTGKRFERVVKIMARLRAPDGCPWDREQTFDTIKPYTLEEAYEVLEAIDNRDWPELAGELGDLLLQVLFYSQMAQEDGHFSVDDVLDHLSDKLIARHPHVFGDVKADTTAQVLRNWDDLKALEKEKKKGPTVQNQARSGGEPSILSGVSSKMPALIEAHKLSSRASRVGFDWPEIEGLLTKLDEETLELREELRAAQLHPAAQEAVEQKAVDQQQAARDGAADPGKRQVPQEICVRLEEEVGDLFFVLVNIARFLSVDPESALRKTNRKFRRRFQWMEASLRSQGRTPEQVSAEELESLWQQAKLQESA